MKGGGAVEGDGGSWCESVARCKVEVPMEMDGGWKVRDGKFDNKPRVLK